MASPGSSVGELRPTSNPSKRLWRNDVNLSRILDDQYVTEWCNNKPSPPMNRNYSRDEDQQLQQRLNELSGSPDAISRAISELYWSGERDQEQTSYARELFQRVRAAFSEDEPAKSRPGPGQSSRQEDAAAARLPLPSGRRARSQMEERRSLAERTLALPPEQQLPALLLLSFLSDSSLSAANVQRLTVLLGQLPRLVAELRPAPRPLEDSPSPSSSSSSSLAPRSAGGLSSPHLQDSSPAYGLYDELDAFCLALFHRLTAQLRGQGEATDAGAGASTADDASLRALLGAAATALTALRIARANLTPLVELIQLLLSLKGGSGEKALDVDVSACIESLSRMRDRADPSKSSGKPRARLVWQRAQSRSGVMEYTYPGPPPGQWRKVAATFNHALALTDDGKVYGFGQNGDWQLGLGHTNMISSPVPVPLSLGGATVADVATGNAFSLILATNGAIYSMGSLCQGGSDVSSMPTLLKGTQGLIFRAIACGEGFAVASTVDGKTYSWGALNGCGQLGLGHNDPVQAPTPIPQLEGKDVVQLACGWEYALARTADGHVYAWGSIMTLGSGSGDDSGSSSQAHSAPRLVEELKAAGAVITEIAAGPAHAIALATDGAVYTWGSNSSGQLGHGHTLDLAVPTRLPPLVSHTPEGDNEEKVVSIAAGPESTALVTEDGHIWVAGAGIFGIPGQESTFRKVTDSRFTRNVRQVSIGSFVAVACIGVEREKTSSRPLYSVSGVLDHPTDRKSVV